MNSRHCKEAVGDFVFNRRAIVALGLSAIITSILAIKSKRPPSETGGWSELTPQELITEGDIGEDPA